jgi:hypothetical protein
LSPQATAPPLEAGLPCLALRGRIDLRQEPTHDLMQISRNLWIAKGDPQKVEAYLVLILARTCIGYPVCFDFFCHVAPGGSNVAIEATNFEKGAASVAVEFVVRETLRATDKGVHGYIANGEAVAGANASAEGGGLVGVGCKHLTVSGRLVASDVSKVFESRTNVKNYFQQKGLKYVIPLKNVVRGPSAHPSPLLHVSQETLHRGGRFSHRESFTLTPSLRRYLSSARQR